MEAGYLGVGAMGQPMAHKLLDAGHVLTIYDINETATPIDASGQLADGRKVNGPTQLRDALLADSPQFVQTLTAKLLGYALGRGVEYYDMPVVRQIVRDAKSQDYRFSPRPQNPNDSSCMKTTGHFALTASSWTIMPSNCRPSTWYGTFFSAIVLSPGFWSGDTKRKANSWFLVRRY